MAARHFVLWSTYKSVYFIYVKVLGIHVGVENWNELLECARS